MDNTESRNTITKLRKKYSLKTNTPFEKLPKVMTPTDYKDYMKATMYPNGKPSENVKNVPDHLREVTNENLDNLKYLFRNRNFTKEQDNE